MTLRQAQEDIQASYECVRRFQGGQRSAFDQLVILHRHAALAFVYRIVGNMDDARDILQEGFLRAFTGLERFGARSSFRTWFYQILINLARDHFRKKGRLAKVFVRSLDEPDREGRLHEACDPKTLAGDQVLSTELSVKLKEAVGQLPERQRLVFCMKHYEGMKAKEIAEVLGCRVSTVKVHLFRGTQAVGARMEGYLKNK